MNVEIAKMRKMRENSEIFDSKPTRLPESRIDQMIKEINFNFNDLYNLEYHDNVDVDVFIEKTIANIYIVLNMFNEMKIYPDYFYDTIVKMNIDYKKITNSDNSTTLRGNYRLYREMNFSVKLTQNIKAGLEKGYYRVQAYPRKDINDVFLEMVGFFESFGIPYVGAPNQKLNQKEQCRKVFNEIRYNHVAIVDDLLNSDYIFEDVEYMSRLLFEYISFFVAIGINPKEYLDAYIDKMENEKKGKQL